MARIVVEHLTKHFPGRGGGAVCAVNNLTFTVEEAEWLVLVGPSGCGKTTTLRLVAGLEQPTSGAITIDGRCVNALAARDRDIAMVFQNPALYPHLSAFENMAFGLRIRRVPKQETADRVRAAAEMLGVAECLDRRPMELSGGQRQRVALGRALVRRPRLLLLDEPLSNLDPHTRAQLRTELLGLRERLATTVLYVTHDQQEAMTLGTRVGVLRQGALQQLGSPRDLYERPANIFVAGFFGSPPMNFLRGTVTCARTGFAFQPAAVPSLATPLQLPMNGRAAPQMASWVDRPVVAGIRPENISVAAAAPEEPLLGMVEAVEELGADQHVHLRLREAEIVARVPARQSVPLHGKVAVRLEMRAACFFDAETEVAIL